MKIVGIDAFVVALPFRRLHQMAHRRPVDDLGRYTICVVSTDDGVEGLGEATVLREWGGDYGRYYGESPELTIRVVVDILGPALAGLDPFDLERANEAMDVAIKGYPYAKAAVDMALYDIKGKALGVPAYQLLGGLYRDRVRLAHSLGIMDVEDAKREAAEAVGEGIRTIKLKVGRDDAYDLRIVREIRGVVGDDVAIVVDANQGWPTPKAAIGLIRRMEEHRIRYVEQPVEGLARMAQVARAVDTPIMADESAWTANDVLEIVERGAADMISMYTTKPGGLTKAKKLAAVAEAAGLPLNVNGSHETGVGNAANMHLIAATRGVTEAGVFPATTVKGQERTRMAGRMYEDDIVTESFGYEDGSLLCPTGPGLGVELDPEKVAAYRVQ
ncbi:MAG TPA: enolase C-terminal domain-like protein [Gaiellaceae bacterium]|nr:enolase C-terminal domain-like protein [Gaiellaceae bacterium]